jgi:hypothetical protein
LKIALIVLKVALEERKDDEIARNFTVENIKDKYSSRSIKPSKTFWKLRETVKNKTVGVAFYRATIVFKLMSIDNGRTIMKRRYRNLAYGIEIKTARIGPSVMPTK